MSGTLTIRPIQAQFAHNTEAISKCEPYWTVTLGSGRYSGNYCKTGGKHTHWNDSMTLEYQGEDELFIEVKDRDVITDDVLGVCRVSLAEITSQPSSAQWYSLYCNGQVVGQILIELLYQTEKIQADGQEPLSPKLYSTEPTGIRQPYPNNPLGQSLQTIYQRHVDPTGDTVQQTGYFQKNYAQPETGYSQQTYGYSQTKEIPGGMIETQQKYVRKTSFPHQLGYTGASVQGFGGHAHFPQGLLKSNL